MDARTRPIGFAHRGARSERKENTIAAFERALELGATGLESDAWLTADGEVVLDHDGVTGPPWRRRPLSSQRRADLPAHMPTLGDLYATCGTGFELSLDVKDAAALGPILAIAGDAGPDVRSRLWLCRAGWPAWRDHVEGLPEARRVESTRLAHLPDSLPAAVATLGAGEVAALNLPGAEWTLERVAIVHRAGLLAFGWGAEEVGHIRRLLDLGADGIYSDHVDRLVRVIGQWSESSEA